MPARKITIVIADDHPLLLKGLKFTLKAEDDFEILGEAADGKEALNLINRWKPSIALLDYDMPGYTGLQVLESMRDNNIPTRIIFLTMHQDSEIFSKAVSLGASGFLLKESIDSEIIKAIRVVIKGGKYYDPMLAGNLINNKVVNKSANVILEKLSKAETNVLKLVAGNKTTREIADQLFISERTVDRHRSNICKKLEISGPNALMHFVMRNHELLK